MESLVGRSSTRERTGARSIGWISTRFGETGEQLDGRRARGVLNPCARESKTPFRGFLRDKLIPDHGLFFSFVGQQGATNGQDLWGAFQGCTGL